MEDSSNSTVGIYTCSLKFIYLINYNVDGSTMLSYQYEEHHNIILLNDEEVKYNPIEKMVEDVYNNTVTLFNKKKLGTFIKNINIQPLSDELKIEKTTAIYKDIHKLR